MEIRNARRNIRGGIDCEINHPRFGWIPFSAAPDDPDKKGRAIFEAVEASGQIAAFVPDADTAAQEAAAANMAAAKASAIAKVAAAVGLTVDEIAALFGGA